MVDVICLCFLQPGEGDFLSFFFVGVLVGFFGLLSGQ